MKRCGILLLLGAIGFVNTALAFNIVNNTDSQIFYRKDWQVIDHGQSYPPRNQSVTKVIISWAKQDSSGTHWDQKNNVTCPVIGSAGVTLVGNCGTMTINSKDNTITCSTGAKTPTCQ